MMVLATQDMLEMKQTTPSFVCSAIRRSAKSEKADVEVIEVVFLNAPSPD